MNPLPLHPAIVHIPLGLAFVLPLVAAGLCLALWRKWMAPRAFAVFVLLQAVLFGAGLVALRTGEADEERAEKVAPEQAIEDHEHAAQRFMFGAGVALAFGVGTLLLRKKEQALRWMAVGTTLATVATAGLAVVAGEAGGKLVYTHGAAQAFSPTATPSASPVERDDDD